MNRHNWTLQEDEQLRTVVKQNGSQDWTKNAQLLRLISISAQLKKRTGKQCRQRWYNHLDPGVLKTQWNVEQETKLFEMHKIYGNKWKQLSKYLPGRTDNDIKNHFYSTLRRSLRRLNKYSGQKNSTSQMREIKPSVLTFIINHIYNHESKQGQNRSLFQSLKQLPQLIFKFSTFKPVKQNMQRKTDDSLMNRITIILNLVDQFKQTYEKQKNIDLENNEQEQKNSPLKKIKFKRKNKTKQELEEMKFESKEQSEEEVVCKQQYESAQNHRDQYLSLINFSTQKKNKQFSPIVTIQRKPSNLDQKPIQKKISMHRSYEHKQYDFHEKSAHKLNLRGLSFHEDDQNMHQMMPIEEPSLSYHQNSNFFGELVVIGKHIEPIQCQATKQQHNFSEIDQVLYQNYDK